MFSRMLWSAAPVAKNELMAIIITMAIAMSIRPNMASVVSLEIMLLMLRVSLVFLFFRSVFFLVICQMFRFLTAKIA